MSASGQLKPDRDDMMISNWQKRADPAPGNFMISAPAAPRNPFGARDAPDPDGADIDAFAAACADLPGIVDDANAAAWCAGAQTGVAQPVSLEGFWCSRWNGGADGTVPGDTPGAWKDGRATLRVVADRLYVLFDWNGGKGRALIEARRAGADDWRGRYVNLGNPAIHRPWLGRVVDERRIDGRWTNGRLDFRR